jgi:hypothetical protein
MTAAILAVVVAPVGGEAAGMREQRLRQQRQHGKGQHPAHRSLPQALKAKAFLATSR